MADILITDTMDGDVAYQASPNAGPIWVNELVGYWAFNTTGEDLVLWKTSDGGATWALVGTIDSANGLLLCFALWYDRSTSGDSGTVIHIAYQGETTPGTTRDGLWYKGFDTATDTFVAGTNQRIINFSSETSGRGRTHRTIGIVKARGGYLYIGLASARGAAGGGTDFFFYRSVDAGINWTARTDFIEDAGDTPNDFWILQPGNYADDQDIDCAYLDHSADEATLKVYDDSGNSWTETSIDATGYTLVGSEKMTMAQASIRHSDGHMILAVCNQENNAAGDIEVYDINGAGSITAKANPVTNKKLTGLGLTLDQNTDDIYVFYCDADDGSALVDVFYIKSADGGGSWGSPVQLNVTQRQFFDVSADASVLEGGRIMPIFYDDANDDAYTNFDNSFARFGPPALPHIVRVAKDLYAIAFRDEALDGKVVSLVIRDSGSIGVVLDTLEFDTSQAAYPTIVAVPNSAAIFGIAYRGVDADGFLKTMGVTTDRPGVIWIEGEDFHYMDADGVERTLRGLAVDNPDSAELLAWIMG